jgi:pimeloyl-ACP methyl ester carboxylesterase
VTRGEELELDADGVRVHAVEWRPARAGADETRVLLVHGLGANTISWEPVGQRLADALDATITAIDLVGFGRTRAPERRATLGTNRRLVTAILENRGPAVLMGNSMGGAIGIGVTARRPELVDALVLVDPALPHPSPGVGDWLRLARLAPAVVPAIGGPFIGTRARLLGPARLVDTTLSWSVHDMARVDPALRDRLVALATERFGYPEAPGAYAAAVRSLALSLPRDIPRDLARAASSRPVLIVHGEHDRLVPLAAVASAVARNPQVTLEVLDGVGHAPQLEDPERLTDVVARWLGSMTVRNARDAAEAWPDGRDAGAESTRNARMGQWQASSSSRSGSSSPT